MRCSLTLCLLTLGGVTTHQPAAAQAAPWRRLPYSQPTVQLGPGLPPEQTQAKGRVTPIAPLLILNGYPIPATFYVARLHRYCTTQDFLALLPLSRIRSVQRLGAPEFQARYGLFHPGGSWIIEARAPRLTADLKRAQRAWQRESRPQR